MGPGGEAALLVYIYIDIYITASLVDTTTVFSTGYAFGCHFVRLKDKNLHSLETVMNFSSFFLGR